MADELVTVPQDLTLIASDDEVRELEARVTAEFNRVNESQDVTTDSLNYMMQLANDLERIRVEITARDARAASDAERLARARTEQRQALENRVRAATGQPDAPRTPGGAEGLSAIDIANATAQGVAAALVAAVGERTGIGASNGLLERVTERATASLSAARRHAPATVVTRPRQSVTAGVDIPGIAHGGELANLDAVTAAVHRRAKSMPVTRDGVGNRQLVATLHNEFEHTVDDRTPTSQIEDLFAYLTGAEKKEALLAAGGWCAPSETKYDFFNIADSDGLIDLPSFGVQRGGIRFPVSPSIADAFGSNALGGFAVAFSNTSDPWLWTEIDDAQTVTGSGVKPTMRVPCPSFTDVRLECYGLTLTAGNLTDDAYPEATRNILKLLMTAHSRAINARYISTMVALSSAAITGISGSNPAYQQILDGIELAAVDYRAKYGMRIDAILEVVLPFWVLPVIRADLAWRAGADSLLSVSDQQIRNYFADRRVRAQFVNDWQIRGSGQFGNSSTPMTAWPTSVQTMIYAAGTFVRGNGLTLDLGVVRDSVLNAENDHTAAWSEECHLIARVGHESRLYTIGYNVKGTTGALLSDAARV